MDCSSHSCFSGTTYPWTATAYLEETKAGQAGRLFRYNMPTISHSPILSFLLFAAWCVDSSMVRTEGRWAVGAGGSGGDTLGLHKDEGRAGTDDLRQENDRRGSQHIKQEERRAERLRHPGD